MLFSKANKTNDGQKKPNSLFKTLMLPDVGSTVRPMRESTAVFLNLLALVFASQGLFPRNHPALSGLPDAPRLTLTGVIRTAWRNLKFSQDQLPQILLFFGVISVLIFSTGALLLIVLGMFTSKAHAQFWTQGPAPSYGGLTCQGTGFFTPCDPVNDIATNWIMYLFQGKTMINYLSSMGQIVPQSTTIQGALIGALSFYSQAIMCVAVVVLFYHLATMIVNTAHHGRVMGQNANQVWAPIRLVFAVGLLVPIATGQGQGLNAGQYIVLQIAQWGSNMADQVWYKFLEVVVTDSSTGVQPSVPRLQKAVWDTVMSQACAGIYNASLNGWTGTATNGLLNDDQNAAATFTPDPLHPTPVPENYTHSGDGSNLIPSVEYVAQAQASDGSNSVWYGSNGQGSTNETTSICGRYTFAPSAAADPQDPFAAATQAKYLPAGYQPSCAQGGGQGAIGAFCNMEQAAQTYVLGTAQAGLAAFVMTSLGGAYTLGQAPTNQVDVLNVAASYTSDLNALYASAMAAMTPALQQAAGVSAAQGWVSAGAWFNTIAREQADLMDVESTIPATEAPPLVATGNQFYDDVVLPFLVKYEQWMMTASGATINMDGLPSADQQVIMAEGGYAQSQDDTGIFDNLMKIVDIEALRYHVWSNTQANATACTMDANNPCFKLGVQFLSANPLAEIVAWGFNNMKLASDLFDASIKGTMMGGALQEAAAKLQASLGQEPGAASGLTAIVGEGGKLSSAAGSALGTISVLFFSMGFMLAYYLPLLPFLFFLFNTLTWILSLFEAVIAVPLIALAHITPYGEGLPGDSAKAAYYYLFSIFLRPILMVFGLIVAFLIFLIAASLMNMLYAQAVGSTGGLSHGHLAFSRIVYTAIYVIMMYTCANNAFKLIGFLPENALRWMGQQGLSYGGIMGDPGDRLEGHMAGASNMFDRHMVQGAGQAAGALGASAGGTGVGIGLAATKGNTFGGLAGAGGALVGLNALASDPAGSMANVESGLKQLTSDSGKNVSGVGGDSGVTKAAGLDTEKMKADALAAQKAHPEANNAANMPKTSPPSGSTT